MNITRFAKIVIGKWRNQLATAYQQAKIQTKLIAAEPSLATAFGPNSIVEDSSIAAFASIRAGAIVKNSVLERHAYVGEDCLMERSTLGKYSYTGANNIIRDTTIGNFCSIANGLSTGSGNHPTNLLSTSPAFYMRHKVVGISFAEKNIYESNPSTRIGHDVWIGANVFIKSGVTVGNGAIIAAGAVVMKDVAPYAIVGKVPAQEIRKRFTETQIAILEQLQWWHWSETDLQAAAPIFQTNDVEALQRWKKTRIV